MQQNYRIKFLDTVSAYNGNVYIKGKEYTVPFYDAQSFVKDNIAAYAEDDKPLTPAEIASGGKSTKGK